MEHNSLPIESVPRLRRKVFVDDICVAEEMSVRERTCKKLFWSLKVLREKSCYWRAFETKTKVGKRRAIQLEGEGGQTTIIEGGPIIAIWSWINYLLWALWLPRYTICALLEHGNSSMWNADSLRCNAHRRQREEQESKNWRCQAEKLGIWIIFFSFPRVPFSDKYVCFTFQ